VSNPAESQSKKWLKEATLFDANDRWVVSAINRLALVDKEVKPSSVILRDDTLRSGANTPGVYATIDAKMKIAERLDEMGVKEAEVAYANLEEQRDFVKMLKKAGSRLKLGVHVLLGMNSYKDGMNWSIEAGADNINMVAALAGVSAARPEITEVMESIHEAVSYSKEQGMFTTIGGVFYDMDSIRRLVTTAVSAGADRICIYDARGWFTPEAMSFLVRYAADIVKGKAEISVHVHNDSGLATINTLEAIKAGAGAADVTLNGTGHRCGNASFEQVVVAAEVLYDIRTGIELSKIFGLCKLVEELYGVPIPANSPHVGETMYTYGGAHIPSILRGEWYEWENVKAETLGCSRGIFWGPTIQPGRSGPISSKVAQMGLSASDQQLDVIYGRLQEVIRRKKFATDKEMEQVIRECLS